MQTMPSVLERRAAVPEGTRPRVAILVPCYNEELTIADVVRQFRAQLPGAVVYVFDNNSADRTAEEARRAGAIVRREQRQGKGYVVQSMFRQVDADIYVMVDGDGTYPAATVQELIAPILNREADMAVESRLHHQPRSEFSPLPTEPSVADFVKDMPLGSGGFEVETELTIKALQRGYHIVEVPTDLSRRPDGSHSKIRWVRDGVLILNTILALFRDYKPLTFFGAAGLALIVGGLFPGVIVTLDFLRTGLVPRLPSAVLAVGLVLCGMLLIIAGLIVHTIVRRFQELDYQVRLLATQFGRDRAGGNV